MIKIDLFDAKTHFSDLLKRVQRGEEIIITNRGKSVAKLTSCKEDTSNSELFIKRIKKISKGQLSSLSEIKSMKEEGSRF
ncbi:hypothetical protein MNBD_BACTEROID05-765 [hydrothermal vent metagenome]|uniref:Antitoxin n=1 Tax=hydrothermal vent metagenome TaxID=652676 RepID=A0A3B0TEK1_9ZZZZ